MAHEINEDYPSGMTDDQLLAKISEINKMVTRVTQPGSNASLGINYYISMLELGQYELTKRIQSGLLIELQIQRKSNKRTQVVNWALTFITIALAIITIFFGYKSLDYAKSDMESDEKWQKEQIQELKTQNFKLQEMNDLLQKKIENDSTLLK